MSRADSMPPRAVLVTRPTDYENLLARHATHGQARFFLETRGQSIEVVQDQHRAFGEAMAIVQKAVPVKWRRTRVLRSELDRFLFEPDDIVIAVGQDGLVANIAKYLNGQPVVGINPAPDRFDGVLCKHAPQMASDLIAIAAERKEQCEMRTMVEAKLDDGQCLLALNELYVGHRTHQSSRYRIGLQSPQERQSSSGVVVATGTGATGWARSIRRQRNCALALPTPTDPQLAFFVREAFPSIATGVEVSEGLIAPGQSLKMLSEMNEDGVIFGDGIEEDRMAFGWGMEVSIQRAEVCLRLTKLR